MNLRLALCWGLLWAAPALGGCSNTGLGSTGGADICEAGKRRCSGNEVQTCDANGAFVPTTSCGLAQSCDATLGCIDCSPGTSVCANNNLEVHSCTDTGQIGPLTSMCSFGQTCQNGSCVDSCEVAASEFVYVVDVDNNFLSFEPRIDSDPKALKVIGKLNCTTSGATPFSMAVDRKARAWVLYNDGNIYFVSPKDASCTPSGYTASQMGFTRFGMGFVSDASGSRSETLYVGSNGIGGTNGLAKIDPLTLTLAKFADFPAGVTASPEMSGTGASELFGYFPSSTMDQHLIVRINKTSGAFDTTFKLAPLPAQPNAWAFAHWGGRYYQFVTSNGKNQVRRFNPATQTNDVVQDSTAYRIVGAGVSTCAPLILG
ncbi:MAG TPA: hypothetical protein PLW65_05160 [Pseudomonadota bacterium]|nr:hypothetical protein [Pseudomonadota bacterium]